MSDNLERRVWLAGEEAAWLADKIVAYDDYCKDAARFLRMLSDVQKQLSAITAERDAANEMVKKYVSLQEASEKILENERVRCTDYIEQRNEIAAERDAFKAQLEFAKEDIDKLRAKKFAHFYNEDCWIFQDDGNDYLDSLVCPVVIAPARLKSLLVSEARIEEAEKKEPILWIESDPSAANESAVGALFSTVYSTAIRKERPNNKNPVWPLFSAPIPSPDTAELIRKAREKEREAILNSYPFFKNEGKWLADSIRSCKDQA